MEANHPGIKLVLYSSQRDDHLKKISEGVAEFFQKGDVLPCRKTNELSAACLRTLYGFGIILIIVRNEKELEEIIQLSERFKDFSVVLILDDSIDDLTHKALKLYPRYTGYIKENYFDIFEVLKRMTTKIQNKI